MVTHEEDPRVQEARAYGVDIPTSEDYDEVMSQRPADKEPHTEGPNYEEWATAFGYGEPEEDESMDAVQHFFGSTF